MSADAATASALPLTGVVAALPEEVQPLLAQLAGADRCALDGFPTFEGRLGAAQVIVTVSGDGERNARAATKALLRERPVERLLVAGVAGALSPSLPRLALLIAEQVDQVGGPSLSAPPALVRWAAAASGATIGRVVSASSIIDTPAAKAELAACHAGDGPAVVDLESAACAVVAETAGVPWLVLRAVSDAADDGVPALLNRCRDDRGAVSRGRVFSALLRDPRALPALLELRGHVQTCARALAAAIQSLLEAWPAAVDGGGAPSRTRNMEELL
jgi:adenosylhomocysteine nucleosidase